MSLGITSDYAKKNGPETLRQQRPALTTAKGSFAMADANYHSEQWKQIPDFPQYEVSSLGRVRSNGRCGGGRILKPGNQRGYPAVILMREGERFNRKVHRLVCEAFHGPAPKGFECAHNDGDSFNNRAQNVRWSSRLENARDRQRHGTQLRGETHGKSKLTEQMVREIRSHTARGSCNADAARFGVSRSTISQVRARKVWGHVA